MRPPLLLQTRQVVRHLVFTTFPILGINIKFFQQEYPSHQPGFRILFAHKISKRLMIRVDNNFGTHQVRAELLNCKRNSKELFLRDGIIDLGTIHGLTSTVKQIKTFVDTLPQNIPNRYITCITYEFKRQTPIWSGNDRSSCQLEL